MPECNARIRYFSYRLIICLAVSIIPSAVWAESYDKLTVLFKAGQYQLSDNDSLYVKKQIEQINFTGNWKIIVEGHSDTIGDKNKNLELSKKRAESVKKFLLKLLKMEHRRIVTIYYGEAAPVADNRTKQGRMRNRRVEISIIGARRKSIKAPAPDIPRINDLVRKATLLSKKDQWDAALICIKEAEKIGGNQVADWHVIYGIIGFYTGTSVSVIKPMFKRALQLDPYNMEARDYLGRIVARENVLSGVINSEHGKSMGSPIKINTPSQILEYLRLFNIQPVLVNRMEQDGLVVWECVTKLDDRIKYYFDVSESYAWAFYF